jgi:ssDNA-binding Zn-finger/Zn-ribbon topoisomerase 1
VSATPKIHLTAFKDRTGGFIFVGVPDERGRYLRTDKSVALVACPQCHAIKGEPCKSRHGYMGGTHAVRRSAAKWLPERHGADDVTDPPGFPPICPDMLDGIKCGCGHVYPEHLGAYGCPNCEGSSWSTASPEQTPREAAAQAMSRTSFLYEWTKNQMQERGNGREE